MRVKPLSGVGSGGAGQLELVGGSAGGGVPPQWFRLPWLFILADVLEGMSDSECDTVRIGNAHW